MGDTRSKLFGDDDNDAAIDLTDFKPTPPVRPDAQVAKAAAARAGFKSREPKVVSLPVPEPQPVAKPSRRVWRTGRNVQLNMKVTQETVDTFYAIADAQGWVLGEAMEKAVELLRDKYGRTG